MSAKIAFSVRRDQLWVDCAELETTGKLNPDYRKFVNATSPQGYADALQRIAANSQTEQANKEEEMDARYEIGVGYVETLLAAQDKAMENSMAALLSSLVLESWMAFEVLASDLWVVAVNSGPKEVAARVSLSTKLQKADDNITPQNMHALEYDARKELGSFLLDTGRVSFQKLDLIRLYYTEAFGNHINSLFDKTCGGYIFALSAFRNTIIHNAGKVDKHFTKRVQRFPEFRDIQNGTPLPIDGVIVKKLLDAAAHLSVELIDLVDNVLTPREKSDA